jgi:two-component system sensor histidine kinase TctE
MMAAGDSLYTRLVVRIGLVLSISAAALLMAIWLTTQLAANQAYDRMLTGNALQIAENTLFQHGGVSVDVPIAAFTLTPGDQTFYAVLDPDGRTVAGDPEFRPPIPWDKLADGPLLSDGVYQELPVRIAIVGRRMPVAGAHPWAVIALAQTKTARLSFAKSLAQKALLVIVVMGVLTVIAALFTLYQALSPLARIEQAIHGRDPNDLSPLDVEAPVEIHALVGTINEFMRRLAVHRTLMRRVIGDAAHQLRTPVTALISQMEMLSMQTEEARKQVHLGRLRELTRNLGTLVNQLINHAMVQHRSSALAFERLDLAQLVRRETAEILSDHADRNLDIEMQVPDQPCWIAGDATTLREAVKNILGNALQYGAPSLLHVEIAAQQSHWALRFIDDGPGIPEADRERLRKPFSARGGNRSGASLGLSIVEEVMRAHGGEMSFYRDRQNRFTVQLRLRMKALVSCPAGNYGASVDR